MSNLNEKEIKKILEDFRKSTDILCSILFTEDGFIIALDQAHIREDSENHQSLGALCAGVASLAGNSVETIYDNRKIKQISIQAGHQLEHDGFHILIESVSNDVLLSIIFPISLNFGVILFELKQTISKLQNYFSPAEKEGILGALSV